MARPPPPDSRALHANLVLPAGGGLHATCCRCPSSWTSETTARPATLSAVTLISDCNRCISSLNDMHSRATDRLRPSPASSSSAAQCDCHGRILAACRGAGRPWAGLCPVGSLRELHLSGPYDEVAGPRVAFESAKVSLPVKGKSLVQLTQLWWTGGVAVVERFVTSRVLTKTEAGARLSRPSGVALYDPAFGTADVWENFVVRLARCGMLDVCGNEEVREHRQRMVLDTRRSSFVSLRPGGDRRVVYRGLLGPSETLFLGPIWPMGVVFEQNSVLLFLKQTKS